jgi:hypothetical protein
MFYNPVRLIEPHFGIQSSHSVMPVISLVLLIWSTLARDEAGSLDQDAVAIAGWRFLHRPRGERPGGLGCPDDQLLAGDSERADRHTAKKNLDVSP